MCFGLWSHDGFFESLLCRRAGRRRDVHAFHSNLMKSSHLQANVDSKVVMGDDEYCKNSLWTPLTHSPVAFTVAMAFTKFQSLNFSGIPLLN